MKITIYAFLLFMAFGCHKDADVVPDGKGDIQIRIWNGSSWALDDVFVDTSGGQNDFGNLNSNRRSEYKRFSSAYRYAFVSFKIDGKAYTIQPTDYVGEMPLEEGKYTYKISISKLSSNYALLEFIED